MSTSTIDLSGHPKARSGGFSMTLLRFELMRLLRNRRTLVFTLIFPVGMFLLIALQLTGSNDSVGPGYLANVGAMVMISMGVYGAVMASTSAGASVSIERSSGWSRQLRLTPLRPTAYVVAKALSAMVLGGIAVGVTFIAGVVTHKAHMPGQAWPEVLAIVLVGSLVFAAFGLFMGYLLPSENAMQFLGPILAVLAMVGGVFFPIEEGSSFDQVAQFTPIYGLANIARWPATLHADGSYDAFRWSWLANLLIWGAIFIAGAVWRFRKDTARV